MKGNRGMTGGTRWKIGTAQRLEAANVLGRLTGRHWSVPTDALLAVRLWSLPLNECHLGKGWNGWKHTGSPWDAGSWSYPIMLPVNLLPHCQIQKQEMSPFSCLLISQQYLQLVEPSRKPGGPGISKVLFANSLPQQCSAEYSGCGAYIAERQ